jgi:hypothetical protein
VSSRGRGNDFTKRSAKIAKAVLRINLASFVLDGEAVAVAQKASRLSGRCRTRPEGWSLEAPPIRRLARFLKAAKAAEANRFDTGGGGEILLV